MLAVDLMTGARTILSDGTKMIPDGVNLIDAGPIAVDSANGRALVTNVGQNMGEGAVYAVDLATGARTILSDAMTPNGNNALTFPIAITIDSANDRALVLDEVLQAVVTVDLVTGARTILSDVTTPDNVNPFGRVFDIAMDTANDRALVLDSTRPGVVAVDLTTGARTIVTEGSAEQGAVNGFAQPGAIDVDTTNDRALVTDLISVTAVELTSGDRVIVSK